MRLAYINFSLIGFTPPIQSRLLTSHPGLPDKAQDGRAILHISSASPYSLYLICSPYFLLIFWFGSTRVVRYAAEARSEQSEAATSERPSDFSASAFSAFQPLHEYVQFFPLLAL